MTQAEKARAFAALHTPGTPLLIYNIWDAGGAGALDKAGVQAIATGSWSVAAAQGYGDGEKIPLDLLLGIVERIVAATSLPVSVDFEGGYAEDPEALAKNVTRLIATGAVGINFEDQIVGGEGLYPMDQQARRIASVRAAAKAAGVPLFINARTDLFLKAGPEGDHGALMDEALARADAYARAGADGFFVPLLTDPALVRRVCQGSPLPVNVMLRPPLDDVAQAGKLGVARASLGPVPYFSALEDMVRRYEAVRG